MRPLRWLAVSWVFGVLVARTLDSYPDARLYGACVAAVVGLALLARRGARLGLPIATAAIAVLCALPAASTTSALRDGSPWQILARADGVVQRRGERVSLPVEIEAAGREGMWSAAVGRQRLIAPSLREGIGPDDRLLLRGRLRAPDRTCNPGDCDGAWRAAADGVDGTLHVARAEELMRLDVEPRGLPAWLWSLRERLRAAIEATLPETEAALVEALVLGERGAIGEATEAGFRAVGVTHLLSVSGLHLAFAAGLLFALVRGLLARFAPELGRRRPRDRLAAAIASPLVLAYALLTGAEVATLRAALVVSYAFAAVVLGRRLRGLDALAFAALVLLLPRPARLFDVSFQLSFVAALATLYGAPRPSNSASGPAPRLLARVGRAALSLLQVSFAATLATAPLTACWFSEVAPMGVCSNIVAVPLTELLLVPLGICGALLHLVWPPLGLVPLHASGFCAALLQALVEALAPHAPVFLVASPSLFVLTVCAIALLVLARAPGLRRLVVCAGFVALAVLLEGLVARLRPAVEVVFLDVGQGDAAVALLPNGEALVIDGGPDPRGQALLAFLRRRGVRRVALVVLSHPHPDHAGGLAPLVNELPVDELWWNGQVNADPPTRALLAAAQARGVRIGQPRARNFGSVSLAPLGPRDEHGAIAIDPLASENDNSLVLVLSYAGRRLLFAGDIEAEGEAALSATAPPTVDVLKVPHHGSRTSSSEALLDALRPRQAIASLADGNRYRFPHPEVVARYRARAIPLHRTDREGAVTLRIDASGGLGVACARPVGCSGD